MAGSSRISDHDLGFRSFGMARVEEVGSMKIRIQLDAELPLFCGYSQYVINPVLEGRTRGTICR